MATELTTNLGSLQSAAARRSASTRSPYLSQSERNPGIQRGIFHIDPSMIELISCLQVRSAIEFRDAIILLATNMNLNLYKPGRKSNKKIG